MLLNFCFISYLEERLSREALKPDAQKYPQKVQAVAPAPIISAFLCYSYEVLRQHCAIPNKSVFTAISFLSWSLKTVLATPCLLQNSPLLSMRGQFLKRFLQGMVMDMPPKEPSCISLMENNFWECGYWQVGFLPFSLKRKLWILGLSEVSIFLPIRQYFIYYTHQSAKLALPQLPFFQEIRIIQILLFLSKIDLICNFIQMEQQSQYLKNLLKRLEQASQQFHQQYDTNNPHSISTVKFDREDLDSSYLPSKRDQTHTQNNNQTKPYVEVSRTPASQGINETINNTKTTRNNAVLNFNQAKVRKRSEDKFDRELSRRSNSSHRKFKHKDDMVHVRDKLMDIVSFLNAKIEGNPQEVRKVVDMDYVKESVLPKPSVFTQNKGNLLYLPKFQLHDAKLVKSSQILNNMSAEGKADNEFFNLKHSFDKLNDIHSSHSLQERSRLEQAHQQQSHKEHTYRQNINIPNYNQFQRQTQLKPHSHLHLNHSISQPRIYINGRLNNSNSQSKIVYQQPIRQIRPLSEVPAIGYQQHSHFNPPFSQSNIISPVPITNTPYLPIGQNSKVFTHPPALNLGKPPTFRTVTSRPLSTQRLPVAQPSRLVNPATNMQTQKIGLSSRIVQQQLAQSSRLKKKVISSQHFKQQPIPQAQTPKKLLTEPNEQIKRDIYMKQAQEQLSKIDPPKPYNKYFHSADNPFKTPNEQAMLYSSKKSSKFRADMSYDILKSIAEQSEENRASRMEGSGRSSGAMMSSVHEVTPMSDIPRMMKFNGSGSTKLKRRGIELSSSKKGYVSQYWRNQ